jgi:hypothetical protein
LAFFPLPYPFFPFPYPFFTFPFPFSFFLGACRWRLDRLSLLPWGGGMLFVVFEMGVADSKSKFFLGGLFGGLLIKKNVRVTS